MLIGLLVHHPELRLQKFLSTHYFAPVIKHPAQEVIPALKLLPVSRSKINTCETLYFFQGVQVTRKRPSR